MSPQSCSAKNFIPAPSLPGKGNGDDYAVLVSADNSPTTGTEDTPVALTSPPEPDRATQTSAARQLLCLAIVDVVGFSAMMRADEEGTFHRWTGLREELILPLLASHGGVLVNTTGDGIFATFTNPVDGVKWSRELQSKARQRRQGLSMRVSLNYCTVLRDGKDLLGDGINVAARLQELTPTGGVVLTQSVQEEIKDHAEFETRPFGPLTLRNIDGDVMAFELMTDGRHHSEPAPGITKLPSIAVMPFVNLGGQEKDDYLGAGIVEDIVVSLSSHEDLTVISRSSTLAFARQPIDPKAVGEVLDVRYLITGAIRRSNDRIRISAQLLDAGAGQQLTSLRRDFEAKDIFAVQDEIVETTLTHLLPGVHSAERRRVFRKWPSSLSGYDNYLKALDLIGSLQRRQFESALSHLNQAIKADPGFSLPLAWAARWYSLNVGQGWSKDPQDDSAKAAELAMRAIRIDENNALAQATYGHVRSYLFGDFETAITHMEHATQINPNSSTAWLLSSVTLSSLGRHEEAIAAAERSLRLSPFDQWLFIHYAFLGIANYDAGNYERALIWLSRGLAENPRYTSALRTLAVTQIALGNGEKANEAIAQLLELEPNFNLSEYGRTRRLYSNPAQADLFRDRLRQAGAPQ